MPSEVKLLMAEEMARRYGPGTDYLVVGHSGLSGPETAALRRMLRGRGARMEVVKNSIAARVLEQSGLGAGTRFLTGPCALVTGDLDMPELCKLVAECAKRLENKLLVRGGVLDGEPLTPEKVSDLASIPPLPVLQAQVLGAIQAPAVRLLWALQYLLRHLACVLEEVRKQKESGSFGTSSQGEGPGGPSGGSGKATTTA